MELEEGHKAPNLHLKFPHMLYSSNLGFPCGSIGKESTCCVGDLGLIPGLGRFPGEGKGYPLQYSGLENPMDCVVHGVAKSQTQLSDFHFHIKTFQVKNVSTTINVLICFKTN